MGNSLKKGRREREKAWVEVAKAVTRLEAGEVPFDAGVSGAAQCLAGAALLLREQREDLNDAKAKRARILVELQQKCRDLERKRLCPCFLINVCLFHFKKRKLMRQCAHHANKLRRMQVEDECIEDFRVEVYFKIKNIRSVLLESNSLS